MVAHPFLGVVLHSAGGFAAGSFYIPFKKVRRWAWETYWLVGGVSSWIIAPWVVGFLTCPGLLDVLRSAPGRAVLWSYLFGVLWGVGGLTFGLSMRYLGMSLGYALSLGFCSIFGTLVPPIAAGRWQDLVGTSSGRVTLLGIAVALAGIAVCGRAGMRKEGEVSTEVKKAAVSEFNFVKGVWVAVFAGIMSSCMAFAFAAGKPIAEHAVALGAPPVFQNFPVMIIALAGGFTTNFVWCLALNIRNKTWRDYGGIVKATGGGRFERLPGSEIAVNYLFSTLAGITWYFQFFFYGMGTTQMGKYDFSSWTIHMAFIIVFSNIWGLAFREWRGSSGRTRRVILAGILVLVASTIIIGLGNALAIAK